MGLDAPVRSDDVWKREKTRLIGLIPSIHAFTGTLAKSAKQLRTCLDTVTGLTKELVRLHSYASMKSHQDTRESVFLAMVQEISQVYSDFSSAASFIEPEILRMESGIIEKFLNEEQGLGIYRHYLHDLVRRKAPTGSEGEEKIIADASLMSDAAESIYSVFTDADFPYPELKLSSGETVKLTKSAFSLYRTVTNREDRKNVLATFFGKLNEFQRTFGTQMNAQVKKDMFYARARKYNSALESALDANNIPVQVYHSLVDGVNKNLATFHRYLNLRKRILGLKDLHYYTATGTRTGPTLTKWPSVSTSGLAHRLERMTAWVISSSSWNQVPSRSMRRRGSVQADGSTTGITVAQRYPAGRSDLEIVLSRRCVKLCRFDNVIDIDELVNLMGDEAIARPTGHDGKPQLHPEDGAVGGAWNAAEPRRLSPDAPHGADHGLHEGLTAVHPGGESEGVDGVPLDLHPGMPGLSLAAHGLEFRPQAIGIGIIITATGGTVEYDCATGRIDEPIVLRDGRFDVVGVHWPGMGGPIGVDTTLPPRPARYRGTVRRDWMTLTVTLTDTNEVLGPFLLERGRNPSVFKCL